MIHLQTFIILSLCIVLVFVHFFSIHNCFVEVFFLYLFFFCAYCTYYIHKQLPNKLVVNCVNILEFIVIVMSLKQNL